MKRHSLTALEVELLRQMRDACQKALREGLADFEDRLNLQVKVAGVDNMLKEMEKEL